MRGQSDNQNRVELVKFSLFFLLDVQSFVEIFYIMNIGARSNTTFQSNMILSEV
jgi:hypothetical protein